MCITDDLAHVCAINSLQRHIKAVHYKGNYVLCKLEVINISCHGKRDASNNSEESIASKSSTSSKDDHEGDEDSEELEEDVEEDKETENARESEELLSSDRRIADEDFEVYLPCGGPLDESTGGEPNDKDSEIVDNEGGDMGGDINEIEGPFDVGGPMRCMSQSLLVIS